MNLERYWLTNTNNNYYRQEICHAHKYCFYQNYFWHALRHTKTELRSTRFIVLTGYLQLTFTNSLV